jgi:hypothetical protein
LSGPASSSGALFIICTARAASSPPAPQGPDAAHVRPMSALAIGGRPFGGRVRRRRAKQIHRLDDRPAAGGLNLNNDFGSGVAAKRVADSKGPRQKSAASGGAAKPSACSAIGLGSTRHSSRLLSEAVGQVRCRPAASWPGQGYVQVARITRRRQDVCARLSGTFETTLGPRPAAVQI